MGNKVKEVKVSLYDRRMDCELWGIGGFPTISDTFKKCKELSKAMGREGAFMIPSTGNQNEIWFDVEERSRFCFKLKIVLENTECPTTPECMVTEKTIVY